MTDSSSEGRDFTPIKSTRWDSSWPELADDSERQELLSYMEGRFGIPGPPAILFFGRDGQELRGYRVVGFESPEIFLKHLRSALP